MNAKRAKQLRRVAAMRTKNLPQRQALHVEGGVVVNDVATTRGLYRNFKRTVTKP